MEAEVYQETEDTQTEVKLSEQLFDEYYSAQSTWERQAIEDRDFYNGTQWTDKATKELKRLKQFPIVVNVIKPAVEQAKALLTTNKPRFNSTGREDSDTKLGKMFSDVLSYIWDISYGNVQLKKSIEEYYTEGRGNGLAYFDPKADFGKGEIYWRSLNPKNIYPDPNAKDIYWRDAAHVIVAEIMTAEQIKSVYGDIDLTEAKQNDSYMHASSRYSAVDQNLIDEYNDQYHKKYLCIDRYTKIKEFQAHAIDTDGREHVMDKEAFGEWVNEPVAIVKTPQTENILLGEKAKEILTVIEKTGNVFHYVQTPQGQLTPVPGAEQGMPGEIENSTTMVEQLIIANLIKEGLIAVEKIELDRVKRILSIGGLEVYTGVMQISEYPFLVLPNHWNRNPYPMSDVRFVRPLQEYVNKLRSLIVAHTSNSVNTKWWLPRGSQDKKALEAGLNQAGTFIGEYDAELGAPVQASPAPLPNELYKNEADARRDIQEMLGIYPLMQGDAEQAPQTFKGTVALDEYGQRRIKSKKDDIEGALNHFCKVLVEMIQAYYTEYKVMRLIQPDASVKTVELNIPVYDDYSQQVKGKINDVTVGKYDVVVVSGSMLPSNRWAQFEYYAQMYQMNLIDQVEVLKKTEVVDTEGVLERFSQIKMLEAKVAELQQQLEDITGDKQTTDRENLHLKQKVEVEKFKTGLNTSKNRVDMATQLYDARLNDELKVTRQVNKQKQNNKDKNNGRAK